MIKPVLFTLICVIGVILSSSSLYASSFTNSYLRLGNQTANSSLSATVCVRPSSQAAGTENKILITFPNSFSLSPTASNWTTNTTNLPSGASSWPSIGSSATSVSGQTATFSSGDLSGNLLYCFNLSSSLSTVGSSGDDKVGLILTRDSSNTDIDSDSYAVSVVSSNQVNVTAAVGLHTTDLSVAIDSPTNGSPFSQNTEIPYTITYGSESNGSLPLTVQAEWSRGTISGGSTPSVDILDYVIGSASNAYNSTPPIIDTVNRTITWTISSFPANTTGQTLNFKLKTNDSYTGSSLVNFTVDARLISGTTVTPDETIQQGYLYKAPTQSSTPTPTPIANSNPPTPTPTTPTPLTFNEISIITISHSSAQIFISTNKSATLNILYGTSPLSLTKAIKTLSMDTQNQITFSDLFPNTTYYFKVKAKDANGNTEESDIFTFKTALISDSPQIDLQTILVTSNNNIILNPALNKDPDKYPVIVLPKDSTFEIQFSLKKFASIKNISAIIKDKNVLGFSFPKAFAASKSISFVETQPGVYTGSLPSGNSPGLYEIYLRISDYSGNISEQKIAELKVTTKIGVFKKGTNQPIEDARMLIYLYNIGSRTYQIISREFLPIQNPSYSGHDGRFETVLPYGKYKAELTAIGYDSGIIKFEVGPNDDYPTIYLVSQPFNIFNTLSYYGNTFQDAISTSQSYLQLFSKSNRLFDLVTFISLIIFIIVTFAAFSARTHIPIYTIPYFFIHRIKLIFPHTKKDIIFGKVHDVHSNLAISRVNVQLIGADKSIIGQTISNKLGEFYFHKPTGNFKISAAKKEYLQNQSLHINPKNEVTILMEKNIGVKTHLFELFYTYLEAIFGLLLESLLFMELVLEIYFIFTFGFLKVIPFILLTSLTTILIFFFIYKPRRIEAQQT